ncbi:MAG: nucleotidyltransferase family protein [Planctomycetota bacterium]
MVSGKPTAIVLAAGSSRRMGDRNKLLLRRPSKPMVRIVCERVLASDCDPVIVVLGYQHEKVQAALGDLPLTTIVNLNHSAGMATSITAGVEAASMATAGFLFALGDMPEVTVATYAALVEAFIDANGDAIVVPDHDGRRGNPVIFPQRYREQLRALGGDQGARRILSDSEDRVQRVMVDDPGVCFDVDHPDQL